jgi:hypothetical protein
MLFAHGIFSSLTHAGEHPDTGGHYRVLICETWVRVPGWGKGTYPLLTLILTQSQQLSSSASKVPVNFKIHNTNPKQKNLLNLHYSIKQN